MKRVRSRQLWIVLGIFAVAVTVSGISCSQSADKADLEIVNVSYDPTRELYDVYKVDFAKYWKDKTGETVRVSNTHAGSGKQARAVIDGMQADVVTLALAFDIEGIAKAGLIAPNWISRLPHNSAPYTSTIVFPVRKGNPKGIKDWGDLIKPGVEVITPNPQTSGGARWNYLAAWGYILKKELGDLKQVNDPANAQRLAAAEKKARAFLTELFKHVPVLDTGARGSTLTFVQRKKGDVLLAWENEALLTLRGKSDQFEMVVPSISILAEPSVAVVDKVVDKRGTRKVAEAFLEHLYSPEGQELAAQHFYRPRSAETLAKYKDKFPAVELFTIDDVFGGWKVAQKKHFDDGGEFDKIYKQ
jgi:sulfate transport system substrate-binding protein